MLEKSGVTMQVLDGADEGEKVEETAEEVRIGLLTCLPWLMVTTGYTATSSGGRCIMKYIGSEG